MNIVLIEPEIPQNTGNISRTCVMTGSKLYLVGKLGFSLDDRYLRRAGLDYWRYLQLFCYEEFSALHAEFSNQKFYFFSAKAKGRWYNHVSYGYEDFLVFGKETSGLPKELLQREAESSLRIPMIDEVPRSLNLSNSVAVVVYEALRQQEFPHMR